MQFLFQPLTWGFLLVGVPILVHLINMLRHRKQKWAAMDFLLESYRRNRRWVMLNQWLLLASRILAMVLLVAMLAKWISGAQWLSWIGGQTTHHYILLDDSYSMGEIEQNETAYNRGLRALGGLVRAIAARPGQHQITLLRWSRASLALNDAAEARIDDAADLMAQSVPRDPIRLLDRLNATQPTSLQLSAEQSVGMISPLITENSDQQSEVYLLTDMRRNELGEPEELRNQLQALSQSSVGLHLIDCANAPGTNMSIVSVDPEQEVWAAGVPLMVRFQVRNRTNQTAKNVIVRVKSVTYAEGSVTPDTEKPYSGAMQDLPPVVIEQISPGETVTRQVQVIFGVPGEHVVEVSLADDVLPIDNRRWCTIGIKQAQQVLLVDGELDRSNAFFFENVIRPDARLSTGFAVESVDAAYLRDVTEEKLNQFDVIALLDVPRLDPQAIEKLEQYCSAGGGLLHICGRNTNLNFVNEQLFRDGAGFFPARLVEIREHPQSVSGAEPQVVATEHPILAPMLQLSSSPFFLVQIRKTFGIEQGASDQPGLEIVATGPQRSPLALDKRLGKGRVLTLLTGLTADWSNWAQDPTFVVLSLRSLGYLGGFRRAPTSFPVGSSIEVSISGKALLPEADVLFPAREEGSRIRLQREIEFSEANDIAHLSVGMKAESMDRDLVDNLLRPGVFEAWMVSAQGEQLVRNFAHNVLASEGNLDRVTHSELESKMGGVPIKIQTAESLSAGGMNAQEASHSTLLMCLLGVLLLGEQALAYSASYHIASPIGARR